MPEPVPADDTLEFPVRRSRWPLYLGIAAPFVIVGGIFFAQSTQGTAHQATNQARGTKMADEQGALNKVADGATRAEGANTGSQAPADVAPRAGATITQVALGIHPAEAHAFDGEKDLGTNPVLLDVPHGETIRVEIRHDGYVSQSVEIDGSATTRSIVLEKQAQKRRWRPPKKKTAPPPPQKKKAVGGGEIVNPWD
jgi:hypothetical protein